MNKDKYNNLWQECLDSGWQARVLTVEIGCRGFPAQCMWNMMRASALLLGLVERQRKDAMQKMIQATEKASCWFWMMSKNKEWRIERIEKQKSSIANQPVAVLDKNCWSHPVEGVLVKG